MVAAKLVNVGTLGSFEATGKHSSQPSDMDVLFQHLADPQVKALVLHFHGGLISEEKGIAIAKKMAPVYEAAGAHPLSFVWETGLVETFRDNLLRIHETKLFQKLLKWVLRRVAKRFGGFGGRGAGVPVPMDQIELELAKPEPFASYDDPQTGKGAAARGSVAVKEEDLEFLRAELQAEFQEDVDFDATVASEVEALAGRNPDAGAKGVIEGLKLAKTLAMIAFRVIRRHVRGRDHGFYPTVVEEILREIYVADLGAWVWSRMKEKAGAMWLPNQGLVGEELKVGTYVLEKIAELQAARPDFRVDVVGHSAGSIAICEMLGAIRQRNLKVKLGTIAFLAPAGRSELGVAHLIPQPRCWETFRVFTMDDAFERKDHLGKQAYTRSLLYFISGVLEPDEVDAPIMGMMRHASQAGPFKKGPAATWAAFMKDKKRLVLSDSTELNPTATDGRRSSSRAHGDFDDDPLTRESLTWLLKV